MYKNPKSLANPPPRARLLLTRWRIFLWLMAPPSPPLTPQGKSQKDTRRGLKKFLGLFSSSPLPLRAGDGKGKRVKRPLGGETVLFFVKKANLEEKRKKGILRGRTEHVEYSVQEKLEFSFRHPRPPFPLYCMWKNARGGGGGI